MEIRLHWRSPARPDRGRGFAPWVRELRGRNGIYLIRDAATREVYYIGESHTGRLFETLTRHLYTWSGFGSGPSYNPARVEVAWLETSPEDARYQQYELIMHFRPLDNQKDGRSLFTDASAATDEEVPF